MKPSAARVLTFGLRAAPRWALLLAAATFLPVLSPAQEGATSEPDLKERLRVLEEKNRALEERVKSLEESPGGEAEPQTPAEGETPQVEEEGLGLGLVGRYRNVKLTFQLFGDVGVMYQDPVQRGRSNTSFALGSLDFFATAQVGEHFQALSETVVTGVENSTNFSQERLWGSWIFNDRLYAKLGVEHSPVSYWNRLYHHGKWLEMTIDRPFLARFEGHDGILPMHNTGLELGGSMHTAPGRLTYVAALSNGRGRTPSEKQTSVDFNNGKAVDLSLGFSPSGIENLQFGGAFRFDEIPPNAASADPDRNRSMRALIGGGFVSFKTGPWETLGEFAWINDKTRASDSTFNHNTGYLQVGYRIGKWLPYTRFDYRSMGQGDPFYSPQDRDLDVWLQNIGLRFDFISNAAIKVEVGYGRQEERDGGVSRDDLLIAGLQLAWIL